jgi:putative transposase
MKYDPNKHHRRSIRLKGYDYTKAGAYFITICTTQREHVFGDIVNGEMQLSRYGETVRLNWDNLPKRYRNVELDAFIIMPNHVHGIIVLNDNGLAGAGLDSLALERDKFLVKPFSGAGLESLLVEQDKFFVKPAPTKTKLHGLSEIVRGFKTFSARRINQIRRMTGVSVWQRGYYEYIIRNEESLMAIRQYIINNPLSWEQDQLYPNNLEKWDESSRLVFEYNGKIYTQDIVL